MDILNCNSAQISWHSYFRIISNDLTHPKGSESIKYIIVKQGEMFYGPHDT